MINTSLVQKFENELAGAKAQVALGAALSKLLENKEFKKVIIDEFSTKEAARYAAEAGNPALTDRERADALALSQAPGHLKRWIVIQLMQAETCGAQLEELREGLEEARLAEANTETDEAE
ncbi:hypothetical protein [Burkholderia phage vB_BpP_HN01]|nr:hypothetical protein [Burkholderia phage vB_BpP_HN01]